MAVKLLKLHYAADSKCTLDLQRNLASLDGLLGESCGRRCGDGNILAGRSMDVLRWLGPRLMQLISPTLNIQHDLMNICRIADYGRLEGNNYSLIDSTVSASSCSTCYSQTQVKRASHSPKKQYCCKLQAADTGPGNPSAAGRS